MAHRDNKELKTNSFLQGAFIATFGIVLSKILGIIYVIPFYDVIGEQGGALYGYAYNIYSIFLSISTAGIPLAISSITSEYNTLEYYSVKEKVFKIARKYLSIVGIASFIILFIFAKDIAYLIIGDVTGGNSISDITFVIRTISFSILIVPTLSVYRGYLQGHRFITPTSVSQVLEQIIRVVIIIVGSYLTVRVFDLPIKFGVATALLGATIGAFFSLLYLVIVKKRHSNEIKKDLTHEEEKSITNKDILKKILLCAFPFIFCDVCKSLYNSVDTFFVVRTLTNIGYSVDVAETVMSVISTWGNKLNMIIIAIGTGFSVSLIPNLASSVAKKDMKDVETKINVAISNIFYLVIPMTLGLSFLNKPVWNIFYGSSVYGPLVFRFSVLVALVTIALSISQIIALSLKEYKVLCIAVILGLLFNACFDIPLMYLCEKIGIGYFGATLSTILGHILTVTIILIYIKKKYNFSYKKSFTNLLYSLIYSGVMIGILFIVSQFISLNVTGRINGILVSLLYALIGGIIYLLLSYKTGLINNIYGKDRVEKIKNKIIRRR